MNRLPIYGTLIVLGNCGAVAWHLLILARLHSMFGNGQTLLITSLHFLSSSPDNVFRMAQGEWALQFRITAVLLVIFEGLGCRVGVKTLREN